MRKDLFFAVLALVSGCGTPVSRDTTVALRTPVVSERPQVEVPEEALPDIVFTGMSPKERFAFFDRPASSTLVVSVSEGTSFVLNGHVLAEQWLGMRPEMEAGFRASEGQFRARTIADALVLVQDETSVFVADLEAGGAARARFPRDTLGVAREANGTLTAWTANRLIVAPAAGARFELPAAMSSGSASIQYHDRFMSIREDDGMHLVDLDAHAERALPANTKNVQFEKSAYFVMTETDIELWNAADAKPRIRAKAKDVYGAYLGHGKMGFTQTIGGDTSLEIVDLATGKRSSIVAQAASCGGENIVEIDNGQVRTDATCDPGCGSIGALLTPHLVTYDLATGAIVAEQQQTHGPDGENHYYVELAAAKTEAERLGLPPESLVRHTNGDAFIHWNGHALREIDPQGEVLSKLAGPRTAPSHFGYVGQSIVATAGGRAFVWDRKGDLVWTSDPRAH